MAAKRKQTEQSTREWKKVAGFDAFNPQAQPTHGRRKTKRSTKPKIIKCKELPEPETGIHSLAWAQAIVPQSCGFLRLPIEVRNKIYEHVIKDFSCNPDGIKPWKKGKKFHDIDWPNAAKETTALYQLCRQVYVDVYGSSLLYRFKKFHFTSPTVMLNYLWVINPVHKDAIRSIQLDMSLARDLGCFREDPPRSCGKPFDMLASCKGLQHLRLNIYVSYGFFQIQWSTGNWQTRFARTCMVADSALKTIMESVSLNNIRRLKSFEMSWTPPNRALPLEENQQEYLLQIEEGIRKVVTGEQE